MLRSETIEERLRYSNNIKDSLAHLPLLIILILPLLILIRIFVECHLFGGQRTFSPVYNAINVNAYSIMFHCTFPSSALNQVRGFTRYGSKAYRYFPLEVSIDAARQACEDIDGSLALPLVRKTFALAF